MTKKTLVSGALAALLCVPALAFAQVPFSQQYPAIPDDRVVVIPAGVSVSLDQCDLSLKRLMVHGELVIEDAALSHCNSVELSVESLLVRGQSARLRAGQPSAPLQTPLVITLTGELPAVPLTNHGVEPRQIMVMSGGELLLFGASGEKPSWSSLAATALAGERHIAVANADGWQAGDQLVIASSNLDPREAEEVKIAAINGASITLAAPLRFNHFGEAQTFAGKTIDTRAEVGLLSHTIVIQGDSNSTSTGIGGNIMIMNDTDKRPESSRQSLLRPAYAGKPSTAKLQGVELRQMGQRGREGRYPLHWHLVDQGYESYIENSSVHHGFQRAVNVHGTDGVSVRSVVAYHIPNHIFVPSEEGDEAHNRFIGNLGILSLPVAPADFAFPETRNPKRSEQSEERNSVFWLRSSYNLLEGNRAAGAWRGQGFFLDHGGMNRRSIKYAQRASGSPEICQFRDNLAHSIYVGLGSPDLYTPFVRGFGLFTTNHDRRYARNPDRFTHCTMTGFRAYKTQNGGTWSERGTTLEDLLVTDSHMGTVAGDVIRDAVVVGQTQLRLSAGDGMVGPHPERSRGGFAQSNNGGQRITGRIFENLTCINLPACLFVQTGKSGIIDQLQQAKIDNVKLQQTPQGFSVGGDPVVFSDGSVELGRYLDVDGSLTGTPGTQGFMSDAAFLAGDLPYINRWGWQWDDTPARQ